WERSQMKRFQSMLGLAILLLAVRLAYADSCVFSNSPRFQLKSDTVEWTMQIVSGQSCIRGLRYGPASIDTLKLIDPPQSGKVTLLGPGFTYAAKSDFQGQDTFTLQILGTVIRARGSSDIRVIVAVGQK